ncbi:probable enoyl-CoA hydratase, mitochondrial [Sipha flava]|uniref:Probable enoyl-CoA hydratase, mitochondrial n=2 Tax=Sipha flava TaxID=143950 RepID=A0A2S2Q3B3_9HEMI|nr:probable enoyl-CoA hydratase, mitochondrial [Sipha flava]
MAFLIKNKTFIHSTRYFKFDVPTKCNKSFLSTVIPEHYDQTINSNIKTFKHQHTTLISLNRPDEKNRLNIKTVSDLRKAISEFENDCSSKVAIIYGEGGSFCGGMESELVKAPEIWNNFLQSYCQKPIIAAVSGFSYDVGFDLCLWCDIRIVEENAVIAVNRKSDAPKSKTFLKRLISTVGYSRAMDLVLTGRDLYSKEAFECGLANRIVACGSSVGQAVNMAFNIGKFPQLAMSYDRSIIHKTSIK